jgi:hypothetical protein
MTRGGPLAAFWLKQISLKSHGTRIKPEMQPAGDDVALRTHGDVLDRSVDIASSAFQSGSACGNSAATAAL